MVFVFFYHLKKIYTKNLEDHAEMVSVWTFVDKCVQQLHYMAIFSGEYTFVVL